MITFIVSITLLIAGYFTYGKERGGRLIILDENEPKNIYSESIEIERITTTEI